MTGDQLQVFTDLHVVHGKMDGNIGHRFGFAACVAEYRVGSQPARVCLRKRIEYIRRISAAGQHDEHVAGTSLHCKLEGKYPSSFARHVSTDELAGNAFTRRPEPRVLEIP